MEYNINREAEYKEMKQMTDWFLQKKEVYETLDNETVRLSKLEKKKLAKFRLVLGIIFSSIGAYGLMYVVSYSVAGRMEGISMLLLPMLFFLLVGLVLIVWHISAAGKFKRKHGQELDACRQNILNAGQELESWYAEYENRFGECRVQFSETWPSTLLTLRSYFESYRVDSIKEALIRLDQDQHNQMLEEQALQTRRAAEATAAYARQTAGATTVNAATNVIRLVKNL